MFLFTGFNSRTLGRVRPPPAAATGRGGGFQFTHPGKGATRTTSRRCWQRRSFNSRTLGRVRQNVLASASKRSGVSIHAPWEGCDPQPSRLSLPHNCFNSRTLGRVRRQISRFCSYLQMFQFTHPGKGATCASCGDNGNARKFQFTHPGKGATPTRLISERLPRVSIHAPWEGCDKEVIHFGKTSLMFQFTHPGKGATQSYLESVLATKKFQFTHPGKGATGGHASRSASPCFNSRTLGRVRRATRQISPRSSSVSIHAPWEGCDRPFGFASSPRGCFNSRTLGRVRPFSHCPLVAEA